MDRFEILHKLIVFRTKGGTDDDLRKFINKLSEDDLNYLIEFGEAIINLFQSELRSRQMLKEILMQAERMRSRADHA